MTSETPILNNRRQNCGSASAKEQRACIMPSVSKLAEGKAEYQESLTHHQLQYTQARIMLCRLM